MAVKRCRPWLASLETRNPRTRCSSDFFAAAPAVATSLLATPALVDALIDNERRRGLLIFLGMLVPYLSTKLDPKLRDTYNFEYAVATARGNSGAAEADEKKIPRSESSFI